MSERQKDALIRVYGWDLAAGIVLAIFGYGKMFEGITSSNDGQFLTGNLFLLLASGVLELGQRHARSQQLVPPDTETSIETFFRKITTLHKK